MNPYKKLDDYVPLWKEIDDTKAPRYTNIHVMDILLHKPDMAKMDLRVFSWHFFTHKEKKYLALRCSYDIIIADKIILDAYIAAMVLSREKEEPLPFKITYGIENGEIVDLNFE